MQRKISFTTLILLFIIQLCNAQQQIKISGKIIDVNKEPLSYSNIVLLSIENSEFISGTTSDKNGNFTINALNNKEYTLKITSIGYKNYTKTISKIKNEIYNVGTITLLNDLESLSEVTITALRPTITMLADKMVVSVEGTAMAQGATAFEVLEKSPGVFVDQNGNIQLNGQGGITVLINDRPVFISGSELQSKLEGMSAEEIKNIEIISNPSSKYDAAGTGGIINIKLKKNDIIGTNGNISTGYGYNGYSAYNTQVNLNFKKNKWNSFSNFGFQRKYRPRDQEVYREFNSSQGTTFFNSTGKQGDIRFMPNLSLGTEFEIDDKQSIAGSINTSGNLNDYSFDTETFITGSQIDDVFTDSKNLNESKLWNISSNIHYSLAIDTLGRKLTTDFNYVKLNNKNENFFINRYFNFPDLTLTSEEKLESDNPVKYDIFSGQVNYETPAFNAGKVEMGVKFSSVKSDNEILFYENINNQNQIDVDRTNHFIINEKILAGYINYSAKLGEKTSFNIGLRAEQTNNIGTSLSQNTENKRNYMNFFPSLFVQHNFSKTYQANLNYSRRIDRPNYSALNPFIFYLDPFSWITGNPSLTPQFTHSVKLTQIFNKRYYLLLTYSRTEDYIAQVPFQNIVDNTTIFTPSNLDKSELFYATLVLPFKISKWWSVNNNITASSRDEYFTINNSTINNRIFNWQGRTNHTFYLPKDFRFEMSVNFRSKIAYGLTTYNGNWGMDLAIKSLLSRENLI